MAHIRLKLKDVLEEFGVSVYALAALMPGDAKATRTTLYRLTNEQTRATLATLEDIIAALRSLTGYAIEVDDLLEYESADVLIEDDPAPPTRTTKASRARRGGRGAASRPPKAP